MLRPRRSAILARYLFAVHGLALAAVLAAGLDWGGKALALLGIALSGLLAMRASDGAVAGLQPRADGLLDLSLRDGRVVEARVLPQSVVFASLVVVLARSDADRRNHAVVLASDSLAPEDLRRLRVWLRWRAALRAET